MENSWISRIRLPPSGKTSVVTDCNSKANQTLAAAISPQDFPAAGSLCQHCVCWLKAWPADPVLDTLSFNNSTPYSNTDKSAQQHSTTTLQIDFASEALCHVLPLPSWFHWVWAAQAPVTHVGHTAQSINSLCFSFQVYLWSPWSLWPGMAKLVLV